MLPDDASVWSNQPDVLWYYTGRTTHLFPQRAVLFDPRSKAEQLDAFRKSVAESPGGAVLVRFMGVGRSSSESAPGVLGSTDDLFVGHRVTTLDRHENWIVVLVRPERS
jgi:hypothetical protein